MSVPSALQSSEQLSRASHRRHDLAEAMTDLEEVIAGPSSADDWLERTEASLGDVRKALDLHIEEVEGSHGLLAEIVAVAPRLAPSTEDLREDHLALLEAWLRAEAAVRLARGGTTTVSSVRRHVTTLLGRLTRHRQAGADLVFEAYNVDIGALD
ncbi:MAG TPA: hypothetical protein VFV13_05925 [Acidimicrobiia bacterium]|nr:hypothetical protein [Acidimicrobiia bacterium]